jgi:hypothetical protein
LIGIAQLLVDQTDLPTNLCVLLLNLALDLQVFISLCILDLQLFVLLNFFLDFSKLLRVFIDLRSNLKDLFFSLLISSSDLFEHLSLLPDHVFGRVYESLPVALVCLQVDQFISLLFDLALLLLLHIDKLSLIEIEATQLSEK